MPVSDDGLPQNKKKIDLLLTVTVVNNGESVIWRRRHYLFTVAETGRGIIYGGVFFFFFFSSLTEKTR